jgi:hypothetical protein
MNMQGDVEMDTNYGANKKRNELLQVVNVSLLNYTIIATHLFSLTQGSV